MTLKQRAVVRELIEAIEASMENPDGLLGERLARARELAQPPTPVIHHRHPRGKRPGCGAGASPRSQYASSWDRVTCAKCLRGRWLPQRVERAFANAERDLKASRATASKETPP